MDEGNKIRNAFQAVKKDILEVKDHLISIAERQERLESMLEDLESKKKLNNNHTSDLVQIKNSTKKKNNSKKK